MPHVNIKHFPAPLTDEQASALVAAVTDAVTEAFGVPDGAVSIALEPIPSDEWSAKVYLPEITGRSSLLRKAPNY